MSEKIRLQKYCSERGLASRRETEELIKQGLIKVNGTVIHELGTKVDPEQDKVEVNSSQLKKNFKYFLLYKPVGYVSNLPMPGEKEAKELLSPVDRRDAHVVGRLDKESEGLLFLTNNGVVANRLKSPQFNIEKEYLVTLDRELTPEIIKRFANGLNLAGTKLKPVKTQKIAAKEYQFILTEGKNRQIRRMLNKFDYQVLKLKRVRIGILKLKDLQSGKYRSLAKQELVALKKFLAIN